MFDLSECHLKELPSGVFVLCKVLRKEVLLLHRNQLPAFRCPGGQLMDLSLIRILDLRENKLKSLPDDIYELTELRELFLSHNLIDRLPKTLHRLKKLEILDLAENRLTTVLEIKHLVSLRVLLLNDNDQLHSLSSHLATCDSLNDLVVDTQTMQKPPPSICGQGTKAILDYLVNALQGEEDTTHQVDGVEKPSVGVTTATRIFMENEQLDRLVNQHLDLSRKALHQKTNELLSSERMALEKNQQLEEAARHNQDARRELLLKEILAQTELQENQINELNTQRNQNRDSLIRDIMEEEERWTQLVQQSIEVKSFAVDPLLLEQEAEEQTRLLDAVKTQQQEELRKQEILRAMQNLLDTELQQVEKYQQQRAASSNKVLTKETEKMLLLTDVFDDYNQNRGRVVEQILSDESVQKSAVAALISRKDARSWALVEQMRIIENHLAAISTFEMEKREDGTNQRLNELAERRMMLSQVLMELMEQQDLRKRQLIEMLSKMESEREDGRNDFWLMQYQRLLDTQPENVNFDCRVDPELGFNLLINGVVHCLPFLTRLWQDETRALEDIGDEDLRSAGVRNEGDRCRILKSIRDFVAVRGVEKKNKSEETKAVEKEAVQQQLEVAQGGEGGRAVEVVDKEKTDEDKASLAEEQLAECVICMDKKVSDKFGIYSNGNCD